ncbi:uncharacterized protein G2W53_022166 [Senna tora]|uniref:DUF4283 domain-containing protein n=1 Tax=Senna tora TaxID=362788 RepID=A0A834TL01_9FABA|nr:uncharacterized protein G2W53_022166 [Senna tora]
MEATTISSVWVEFWGFRLEYYTADIAYFVGSMVGNVLGVDFSDQRLLAVEAQKEALCQCFDTVSFMDFESPSFVNEAMAFHKFKDEPMEEDEDPLTPIGYYSDPIGQGSQGGVTYNSPHSSNIQSPLDVQSPINWELIAAESARWQPTSERGTQTEWREEVENRNKMFFGLGDELHILVQSALPTTDTDGRGPQEQLMPQFSSDHVQNASPVVIS